MNPLNPSSQFTSPSLVQRSGFSARRAFEIKFLVDESVAREIEQVALRFLRPDPHADASLGGAYRTTSLYLDTPEMDVFHRSPSYRRRKFRVRRYGESRSVFLERKIKRGESVVKQRTEIGDAELDAMAVPLCIESWSGHWFHHRVHLRRLLPACLVAYSRTAFVGSCAEGPMRVTMDRDIRGRLWDAWRLPLLEGGRLALAGNVVLELKFLETLPAPFKELVYDFRLAPTGVSKYRLCREVWGAVRSGAVGGAGRSSIDGEKRSEVTGA